jgi:hypothetical protein
MAHAQREEFLHFAMDLAFLTRRLPTWRTALEGVLFQEGDIVANAKRCEELLDQD